MEAHTESVNSVARSEDSVERSGDLECGRPVEDDSPREDEHYRVASRDERPERPGGQAETLRSYALGPAEP